MTTKITLFTRKGLAIGAITAMIGLSSKAQDVHFSQIFESPLTLNPALGGAFNGNFCAEANYRSQWGAVAGPGLGYNTMAAALQFHNMLRNWGNGYLSPSISFYNDNSGSARIGVTQVD